ncbi:hypothetical protein BHYA_0024g00160 [Botrytis hyacinthi]|uniref:Uncharacterized protein n=1 Tax=Botrytis hyacinthi TaxID=278943 RepID=A0A4Z1GZH0_9HELO|nr:hypothetical protein BHYA_0024g00160 [Botrytis hyacinthi]
MGKRNNKNGSQKKAGNATTKNDTKLACIQETPVKETTAESTTADETPVMDNPMELIQKLQSCFQSQETDSNALRSETRRLEDKLKDTQDTLKNTREQSQVEISGLNLVIKNLESNLENTREELQTRKEAYAGLEEEYGDDVLKYERGIGVSKLVKKKLQATVKELKSVIQAGCITTEVLKQDFDKERLTHLSEVERLKAAILELQRKNMSKDIEAKPGPSNGDKCIASGPAEEANTDCENCALQSAQIKDMKINLAVLSRSLTQNDGSILTGFSLKTNNDEITTVGVELNRMQVEKKRDWQNSLTEIVQARMLSQKTGPLHYRVLVKKWQTSYSYLETLEISQALSCESDHQFKMNCKWNEDLASLRNELSAQKIETINCQEKLIASHSKVINGMKEQAKINLTEEKIKQDKLTDAHQKATDSLNASYKAQITELETDIEVLNENCENRIMELEKGHLPYRDLAERILAREFEWCKPPRARNEEIIYQGNLAAHGGNCRAVLRRIELSPSDEHNEWFIHWYGISIETFAKHKDSTRMEKLLNMRYEMQKFKTVPLSDTIFERYFQDVMSELAKYYQSPTSHQGNINEKEYFEVTLDSMFSSMCSEYNEAAEYEKRRRKSDWKLGHNGQNMGDSNIDRTNY